MIMFDQLVCRLMLWQLYRHTVHELTILPEKTLRDIGIKRRDIRRRAAEDSGWRAGR
jgi:uncharacterized protein YjiS (DUF1127 family)